MKHVLVLNGPNLSRLGTREPEIYGAMTHADLEKFCIEIGSTLGLDVEVRQSDSEEVLVGWLAEAAANSWSVVINPAAFTHYSYALRDACAPVEELIEVHISNPHAREEFRKRSVISEVAKGTIAGFGKNSYALALRVIAGKAD
jgi:3-dehydroquinate dehydratase-2